MNHVKLNKVCKNKHLVSVWKIYSDAYFYLVFNDVTSIENKSFTVCQKSLKTVYSDLGI